MILLGLLTAGVVMFATGLGMRAGDFTRLADVPRLGIFGLVLQVIGLPIAAMLIARGLGIAPDDGMGLMVLAFAPASFSSHVLVGLAGGNIGLARVLTAWSTAIWLPIMLLVSMAAAIPSVLFVGLLGMLLPLLGGIWIGARNRIWAGRLEKRCALIGSALTGLLVGITLLRHAALHAALPEARLLLAVLLLALVAMLAGLLARTFGRGVALTLAISTPVQNLALPLAVTSITDTGLPAALYSIAMYVRAFAVLVLSRRI